MGASGCAAIGVVTKLMNMHATLSIGIISGDVPCDGGWGGLGGLLECNSSGDLRITSQGCNYGENIS
jgi:hypothetical protein